VKGINPSPGPWPLTLLSLDCLLQRATIVPLSVVPVVSAWASGSMGTCDPVMIALNEERLIFGARAYSIGFLRLRTRPRRAQSKFST